MHIADAYDKCLEVFKQSELKALFAELNSIDEEHPYIMMDFSSTHYDFKLMIEAASTFKRENRNPFQSWNMEISVFYIFDPIDRIPLFVAYPDPYVQAVMRWRLKIGH